MPDLVIRIKKNRDGSAVLTCTRADGSATWQRQEGVRARFFPLHDLTHYAVETTLGHRRGFYGMVAEGWDLEDFGTPWPRGPLPPEAEPPELIAGWLDRERADGAEWPAAELNAHAEQWVATRGAGGGWRPVSDAELARIRRLRADLFARWAAVPPGEALELPFDRPALANA